MMQLEKAISASENFSIGNIEFISVENLLSVSKLACPTLYSQSIRILMLQLRIKYYPLAQVFLTFKFCKDLFGSD